MATTKLKKTQVAEAVTLASQDTGHRDLFDGPEIMIDLETLDTAVSGVILSIGACKFDAHGISNDGFYRAITIESNLAEHRTISPSTLLWWLDQTDRAKQVLTDPQSVSLSQALDDLREWIGPMWKAKRVYGNGADFDISMLAHAYHLSPTPWQFYNVRCFRTIKNLTKAKDVPKPANALAHNALFDAVAQAQHLIDIWKAGAA